jgi:hypothetical protein
MKILIVEIAEDGREGNWNRDDVYDIHIVTGFKIKVLARPESGSFIL